MEQARPQAHPATASRGSKLRLLALHSFRTSAKIFKEQFARARMPEKLGSHVDVVFIDAPTPATGQIPRDVAPFFDGPYYEWFTVETMGDKLEYDAVKLEKSVRLVARTLREQGPFDGLVGFSQGTALASTVLALQVAGDALMQGIPLLKFCVLFAGFKPRYPPHAYLWEKKLPIPSLHIYGDKDELRPACKELADSFENAVVIQHTQGHRVPLLSGLQVAVVQAFLSSVQQQAGPTSQAQPTTLTIPSVAKPAHSASGQQQQQQQRPQGGTWAAQPANNGAGVQLQRVPAAAASTSCPGDGDGQEAEELPGQLSELRVATPQPVRVQVGSSPASPSSQCSTPQARL